MQSVLNGPELLGCIFHHQQLVEAIDWCWCGLMLLRPAAQLH